MRPGDPEPTVTAWVQERANEAFVYVTTRGRRTGNPHTIEIWFGTDGGPLYLLSGGGAASDWVRNMRAEPEVEVQLGGETRRGRARLVTNPDEDFRARRLLAAKYQDWRDPAPLSGWAATALAVAIEIPD